MLAVAFVFVFKKAQDKKNDLSVPSSDTSIEQKVKEKFNGLVIPEDTQRMELKDIYGGENFGVVTDTEILAYLPEDTVGEIYKAWLVKDGKRIFIGNLSQAKGGWIVNFNFSSHTDYDKIVITAGSKDLLEGSF